MADGSEDDLPCRHGGRSRAATARVCEPRWDAKYPTIAALWQRNWERVIPFFAFPAEIRKVIYTTNAVESLNMSLRKAIKTRGAFPSEEAALKVMYLALRNVIKKWEHPLRLESGAEPLHRALGRPHPEGGVGISFSFARMVSIWPAAVAVKALRCASTADARRGLDCDPRRPNNPTVRAKEKKINSVRQRTTSQGTTFTQNRGHYPMRSKWAQNEFPIS